MDIVDLSPKFPTAHRELFGQLVYVPDYKQKIALEARASRWQIDPPTYDMYVEALHLIFDELLSNYNRKFKSRYRIVIASRESLEPKLPPKANAAFKSFADSANKSGLHPYDWKRFYSFVHMCRATHVNISETDMLRLLVVEGFPEEYAEKIATIFYHLIDFARMR